jgi:hypothetical protein
VSRAFKRGRDALIIMNPRTIPECIRAFDELQIPQIRIIGHTEQQIQEEAFPEILEYDFDWFWLVSDDALVRPQALDAVRKTAHLGHPVVTGYSQRSHEDWTVNLTRAPLAEPHPSVDAYDFFQFYEVVGHPDEVVPTWFTGMSLTGMPHAMWERFPFQCFGGSTGGYASDFSLSTRLQEADIPIVAAREAFCYHWRWDWITTSGDKDMTPTFDNPRIEYRE